jgi:hypothetical protein
MFLLYLIWVPFGRFWLEFLRTDSWFFPGTPFNTAHILTATAVICGAVILFLRHRHPLAIQPAGETSNEPEDSETPSDTENTQDTQGIQDTHSVQEDATDSTDGQEDRPKVATVAANANETNSNASETDSREIEHS